MFSFLKSFNFSGQLSRLWQGENSKGGASLLQAQKRIVHFWCEIKIIILSFICTFIIYFQNVSVERKKSKTVKDAVLLTG